MARSTELCQLTPTFLNQAVNMMYGSTATVPSMRSESRTVTLTSSIVTCELRSFVLKGRRGKPFLGFTEIDTLMILESGHFAILQPIHISYCPWEWEPNGRCFIIRCYWL